MLYGHRQDDSVRLRARLLENGSWECRRLGEADSFYLDETSFQTTYGRSR